MNRIFEMRILNPIWIFRQVPESFSNIFAQIPGKCWSNKPFSKTIRFVAINNWNFVKLSFVMKLLTDQQFHHDIVPAIQFYVSKQRTAGESPEVTYNILIKKGKKYQIFLMKDLCKILSMYLLNQIFHEDYGTKNPLLKTYLVSELPKRKMNLFESFENKSTVRGPSSTSSYKVKHKHFVLDH